MSISFACDLCAIYLIKSLMFCDILQENNERRLIIFPVCAGERTGNKLRRSRFRERPFRLYVYMLYQALLKNA